MVVTRAAMPGHAHPSLHVQTSVQPQEHSLSTQPHKQAYVCAGLTSVQVVQLCRHIMYAQLIEAE